MVVKGEQGEWVMVKGGKMESVIERLETVVGDCEEEKGGVGGSEGRKSECVIVRDGRGRERVSVVGEAGGVTSLVVREQKTDRDDMNGSTREGGRRAGWPLPPPELLMNQTHTIMFVIVKKKILESSGKQVEEVGCGRARSCTVACCGLKRLWRVFDEAPRAAGH